LGTDVRGSSEAGEDNVGPRYCVSTARRVHVTLRGFASQVWQVCCHTGFGSTVTAKPPCNVFFIVPPLSNFDARPTLLLGGQPRVRSFFIFHIHQPITLAQAVSYSRMGRLYLLVLILVVDVVVFLRQTSAAPTPASSEDLFHCQVDGNPLAQSFITQTTRITVTCVAACL
jgi:hypothetical protein